jgi:hypothetical protein
MKGNSIKNLIDMVQGNNVKTLTQKDLLDIHRAKGVVIASLTNEEKSKYIQEKVQGKIFSVSFIKKDGTERNMVCRLGVQKHLSGGKSVNNPNKYLTVFDMQKKAYRNVALETIYRLRCKDVFIG